ncbi:uncharacterized protein APUU_12106S [Aspergillus puulaauensis]|uniref:Mitochondrial ATPase expression-domain-containing protein n=1 Tax=Aspergillus puulaauensis TaxID=1220207 RepID=A0A7R7XDY3_9EURO|nr:uncharacterized protein APUU_12106S [Aspergillus puulaauensis]BCS19278.1 hypothetical protein APUU_12106S [Aspergillus puulaauensis]
MRVIVGRCEGLASHLLFPSCRPSICHHTHSLRPIAASPPQLARWFNTSESLASWSTGFLPKANVGNLQPEINIPLNKLPDHGAPGSDNIDRTALERELYSTLESGQPDQIMAALLNYDYAALVATMPQSVFTEAFNSLSPAYFVEPFKALHRPLHPYTVELKKFKSPDAIFNDFVRNLSAIVRVRRSAGSTLGLAEYSHLLDCARSVGDAVMADHIWHSMKRDGILPDIHCYNHYMEAKVWNSAYTGKEKYHLRVTPYSYKKRKFQDPGFEGYGTASRSVRKEVNEIFDEMTEAGIEGTEATMVNLLLASARVGHKTALRDILKTIWSVDVDLLTTHYPGEVTKYERTSPLYPSGRLLYAVVHAFGSNSDIFSALRLVEHISKSYDIEVPHSVWAELFEWAFVLSRHTNTNYKILEGGPLHTRVLLDLFEKMTTEHNVKPTVETHTKLAVPAWLYNHVRIFLNNMRAAYKIMDETRRKKITARRMVESHLRHPRIDGKNIDPQILRSRAFADAVHTYDVLRLQVMQQTSMIERLVRLLIAKHDWVGPNWRAWERQLLPRFVEEWRDFIPDTLHCWTHTGRVHFNGLIEFGQGRVTNQRTIQVRRPSINDDFTPDPDYDNELEDDVVWASLRRSISPEDLQTHLLKRLFEPVPLEYRDYYPTSLSYDEGIYPDEHINEKMHGNIENGYVPAPSPAQWPHLVSFSREQKDEALKETFGPCREAKDGDDGCYERSSAKAILS